MLGWVGVLRWMLLCLFSVRGLLCVCVLCVALVSSASSVFSLGFVGRGACLLIWFVRCCA